MEAFVKYVQPLLPDVVVRWILRLLLWRIVVKLRGLDYPQKEHRIVKRMKESIDSDEVRVAVETDKANEQHYEVPTAFFQKHLGPRLKYSSCENALRPFRSLDDISRLEDETIRKYQAKLRLGELQAGDKVLEIGSGWGSLLLANAEAFPHLEFHAFSNSVTQVQHISGEVSRRGFKNVTVWKQDVHDFCLEKKSQSKRKTAVVYRRIVSIECIEHTRSYPRLFRKLSSVLTDDGLCFFQILGHREYTYFMNSSDWMGRNFFTGGTIPSMNLFLHFNDDLVVEDVEVVNGKEYANTLNIWLERMYSQKSAILACFKDESGRKHPNNESPRHSFEKWRMFYLMCSECFGYDAGKEWVVGYFLMKKRL
jgi:cyclopropane-fatty-acyl-phospholipid synthase